MTGPMVAVAGGGLAGLTAACHLAEAGVDVRLFERREDVGGRVRTRERDGFLLDRGFQVLFTAYPAVRRELDLDALDLRRFDPGATIARPGRRSVLADPFRDPGSLLGSALNREVTLGDKLRTLALRREALRSDPDAVESDDRSIRAALRNRGFSEAFVEHFAAPFYGGITLDRSLADTSAYVFGYTFAMLSRGATAVPAAGMGAIPAQLRERAERAGGRIETGRAVTDVSAPGPGDGATVALGGETVAADAAVVATDPPTARDLTGVDAIPTDGRGCVTQYLAFDRGTALDGSRRLVLDPEGEGEGEGEGPNQVAPLSAVAPEYAPAGRSLLSATYLDSPDAGVAGSPGDGAGLPDADDAELLACTRETLEQWYPERAFERMELLGTDRIPFAQFDQPPGFRDRLPSVDAPGGDAFLAGDYTEWSSIQGAMASGRDAAEAVLGRLDGAK